MIVNIHEAKTHFSKLVARFLRGEKVIIAKNGKPVLQFAKIDDEMKQVRTTGFFHCDVDMSSFNDPVEGWEEYE